jgi:excisionase family DNA binding protein
MADQLYDETEGRERLGNLGRTKYFELLKNGELRSVKIGRRRMVPASEIERFITRQLDQPADPKPAA